MKESEEGTTVTKGMYHLFLGNTTATFLMAVTAILVTRLLGPEKYGLYVIAILPTSYLIVIAGLGISGAVTRFTAKYIGEGRVDDAKSFLLSMTTLQGLVAIALALLAIPMSGMIARFLSRPELAPLIPLVTLGFVGQSLYNVVTSGYQGLGRMDRSATLQVLLAVLKLALSAGLVLAGYAVTGALVGYSFSYAVAGLVGVAAVVALTRRFPLGRLRDDVKVALPYSLPLYLATLLGGFIGPIQGTLLAYFTTNRNIGGYGAANNISTFISLVAYPISTALFPLFSRLSDDRQLLGKTYRNSVKFSTLFVVPVTLVLMALSIPVSQAIYGSAYTFSAIYLFLGVSPNLFVGFGNLSQGPLLNGLGKTRKVLLATIVGSAVSLGSSVALVAPFGVIGIIAAGMAGSAAALVASWVMVSKELGDNARLSEVARIYVAAAVAAIAVVPISWLSLHPIVVTLLGCVAYLILFVPLLAVTKSLTDEDLAVLQTYFKGTGPFVSLLRLGIKYYGFFRRS
ncbi:MAG TPA: oligosaccharide flippase family protein [Conexivisphaerales archaeon]|nr:oligosaccharide flippase family protein [Conexivisphaerales archaeon]